MYTWPSLHHQAPGCGRLIAAGPSGPRKAASVWVRLRRRVLATLSAHFNDPFTRIMDKGEDLFEAFSEWREGGRGRPKLK